MTLEQAKQAIRDRGFTPLNGASWEDSDHVYASSVETFGPSTYGHPKMEISFSKSSGWFHATGEKPIKMSA